MQALIQRQADLWREQVLPWYRRLQGSEQRILVVAAVVLPLVLLVFGLWLPMRDNLSSMRASLPAVQKELAEANLLAKRIAKGGASKAVKGDLLSEVDISARNNNVHQYITRIKPQPMGSGQHVMVQLRKVPYADAVRFFSDMAGKGFATEQARISDVASNGLVDVDITYSSR